MSKPTSRSLTILIVALFAFSALGGVILAQGPLPTLGPLPIHDATGECVPFNESPMSLRDINGLTNDKFLNPRDLDGDGHFNEAELVARSDPTYTKSTPLDKDGDGYGGADDGCDYDPDVPRPLILTIESLTPTSVARGGQFTVVALLKKTSTATPEGAPLPGADVKLEVAMSSASPVLAGPKKDLIPMTDLGAGRYSATVQVGLGDMADPDDPWDIDVIAKEIGSSQEVRLEEPRQVVVSPTTFPLTLQTFACVNNVCVPETDFYAGESIKIKATPGLATFYRGTSGTQTGAANLTFTYSLNIAGMKIADIPMTPRADPDSPDAIRMMPVVEGSSFHWIHTLNPSEEYLIPAELMIVDAFGFAEFAIKVSAVDVASQPNTGTKTFTAPVYFNEDSEITVTTTDGVIGRRGTVPVKVELRVEGQLVDAALPPVVTLHNGGEEGTPVIPVTNVVRTGVGTYEGSYVVKIGDRMDVDPSDDDPFFGPLSDEDSFSPGPNYVWTAVAAFGTETESSPVMVRPIDVDGRVLRPTAGQEFEVRQTSPGILGFDPINIEFELPGTEGVDYYNDPVLPAPGTATYTIMSRGVAITAGNELTWQPVQRKFTGTATINPFLAQAFAGEWTIEIAYEDDADVPNTGLTSRSFTVKPAGVSVSRVQPTVTITDVYGMNLPHASVGLSGTPADRDNIMGADDTTTRRFIVVKGTSTPSIINVCSADDTCTPTQQNVTGVFVRFHDRFFPNDVEFYQMAAGTTSWQIIFDGDDPLFTKIADGDDVDIAAFAYTGPVRERPTSTVGPMATFPPSHVLPATYLPLDATGVFSKLAEFDFVFQHRGYASVADGGIKYPGKEIFGGGKHLAIKDDVTFLLKTTSTTAAVLKAEMMVAEILWENCDGTTGNEWCFGTYSYQEYNPSGPQPTPSTSATWVPMDVTATNNYTVRLAGPFRQGDCDPGTTFQECRFLSRARLTTEDGFVTQPVPALPDIPGENGPKSIAPISVTDGRLGRSFQWTVNPPSASITEISMVGRPRANLVDAPEIFTWDPSQPTIPYQYKPSDGTRQAVGLIVGDQIAAKGVVFHNDLHDLGLTLTTTITIVDNYGGTVSLSAPATVTTTPDGAEWSATFDVAGAREAVRDLATPPNPLIVGTNGDVRISVSSVTSGNYSTGASRVVLADRNGLPQIDVESLRFDDRETKDAEGDPVLRSSAGPDFYFSGNGKLTLEAFDVDDARAASDPRRMDAVQIAFQLLQPDIQIDATQYQAVQFSDYLPIPVRHPRCIDPSVAATCNNALERDIEGVEFYVPLRVGVDPLLMKVDGDPTDPNNLEPADGDLVFGFDSTGLGQVPYVRTFGPTGNVGVTEGGNWNTATFHAIEIKRDGDSGEAVPYIGLQTAGGGTILAIAFDRGVQDNPSSWQPEEGSPTGAAQWDLVKCAVENVQTLNGQGDTIDNNANATNEDLEAEDAPPIVPTNNFPSNTHCGFLTQYSVGLINGLTPLTIYNNGNGRYPVYDANNNYADDTNTYDDFLGPEQDGRFTIPRAYIWENVWADRIVVPGAYQFEIDIPSLAPYDQLRLPTPTDESSVDMLIPDGKYEINARGIDGVEVFGGANDEGPIYLFRYNIRNDNDADGYSNALENKTRAQIRDGTHRQFTEQPTGYRGSLRNPSTPLPLMDGSITFLHRVAPDAPAQEVVVTAAQSSPCDWDGDGVPNDVNCRGLLDLEAQFNMNPFAYDTPFDDPNNNGIPNFLDSQQRYRFDCIDTDQDQWCDAEEQFAGSDPLDPLSQPGDTDGNGVPDDLEFAEVPDLDATLRELLACQEGEGTDACIERRLAEPVEDVDATLRGILCADAPEGTQFDDCAMRYALDRADCDPSASPAECALSKAAAAEQAARDTLCPGAPAQMPIQDCADLFLADQAGCEPAETSIVCAQRKAGEAGGATVEALREVICPEGAPATMPLEDCADYFLGQQAGCEDDEASVDCAMRKAEEASGGAMQSVRETLCPSEPATGTMDKCVDAFVAASADCEPGESSRACAERQAAEVLATARNRICIQAVFAPTSDPTCGGHTIKIVLAVPGANYVFVDISGSGATARATAGLHDGTGEKELASGGPEDALAMLLGVIGTLTGVVASASDPDGDGYMTDRELGASSNPFHYNSKPTNRGGGWPMDWDADGYANDRELQAAGGPSDPMRHCSTPLNKAGGPNPAAWPSMGNPC